MLKKIQLKSVEDAKKLNQIASQCLFDTWVHSDTKMIDAKSFLGLCSMVNQPNLVYVVPDDINPKRAFNCIQNFAI